MRLDIANVGHLDPQMTRAAAHARGDRLELFWVRGGLGQNNEVAAKWTKAADTVEILDPETGSLQLIARN